MIKPIYVIFFSIFFKIQLNSQNTVNSSNRVYRVVESLPYFIDSTCMSLNLSEKLICSERAMNKFIYSRLSYPSEALENKIEGIVEIKFIVETDGSLSNFEIVKDIGLGCGSEALRVIKLLGDFIPGQLKSKSIRCYYQISVNFELN